MADIFISYAREDREAVGKLAGLLEAAGLSCWWDKQLAAGAKYRERTEIELKAAKAVLVVWTKHSIGSDWVADEAAAAQEVGKLAPISLDGVSPPLGFRQLQVIDFTGWTGDADGQVQELVSALNAFAQHPEVKAVSSPAVGSLSSVMQRSRLPLLLAAVVIVVAASLFFLLRPPASTSPPSQRVAFFGFTAADDNPASSKVAADTTDQTFSEFTRLRIDAAARSDSFGGSSADKLARAKVLGAGYALSGEVRVENDKARIAVRLEDPATRATLWETTETSPLARPFFSPPKQAAFRAAKTIACIVDARAELSRESPERIRAIIDYCADPADLEGQLRAIQSLAKMEPNSNFFQALSALHLIYTGDLPAALRAERVSEADALVGETLRRAPGDPLVVAVAEYVRSARGIFPLEAEQLLTTAKAGGSSWAQGNLLFRRGVELLGNGRTAEGVARMKAAEAARPAFSLSPPTRANALASLGQTADAEVMFEQAFARAPEAVLYWPYWVRASVLEGVGDPDAVISAAPAGATRAMVQCWRSVLTAKRKGGSGPASESLRDCGFTPAVSVLAALGRTGEAFSGYRALPDRLTPEARMLLFAPSARAMRADGRFLALVSELGLWDYWIGTRSHPDVCDLPAEEGIDVCVKLREAQGK